MRLSLEKLLAFKLIELFRQQKAVKKELKRAFVKLSIIQLLNRNQLSFNCLA